MPRNTNKFKEQINRFNLNTQVALNDYIKETAYNISIDVIENTPTDTGVAVSGWTSAVNRVPEDYQIAPYDASQTGVYVDSGVREATRKAEQLLSSNVKNIKKIVIRNSVPYISLLEYGYSTQAPTGFLRNAINKARARAPALAKSIASRRRI